MLKENKISACKAFVLDKISFSYRDSDSLVLEDLTLECQEGEWLVIIGRNGSGKSTLLKILNALLEPKRGVYHVWGLDASVTENIANVRRQAAMVFQNPESQIVGVTVEDDAAFALENQCLPLDDMERRVAFGLEKTGLLSKRKCSVNSLSGGEKQRLTLAGAIAQGAKMFLLDEATSMLDSNGREEILSLFKELHSEGHTIVQVTHNIEEVRYADRIVIIDKGRLVWSGGRKEFFNNAEVLGFDLPICAQFARGIGVDDITDFDMIKARLFELPRDDENVMRIMRLFGKRKDSGEWRVTSGEEKIKDKSEDKSLDICFKTDSSIEVRELSHVYSDGASEKIALDNVSLCINRGQIISLTGHTGSGKSTLIQYLNALYTIGDSLKGEVLFNGHNINIAPRDARRKIGMVFQFPEHQLFAQTVREELTFALKNWEIPFSDHAERINEAIERVGIPASMLERSPFTLSGGEMKAVCIASVLVTKPLWLILDEPVAGLDSKAKRELLSLLINLKSSGAGILIVTHDLEFALLNSDRIIVLNEGKLVCDDVPEAAAKFLHQSGVLRLPDIVELWVKTGIRD
ncbi:MAG: energy-coupling factor transporter ATPase [Synergistaceae bacterium]|nr:energy-coupling factor transporter ATPase [Synergistaceae bacterium]